MWEASDPYLYFRMGGDGRLIVGGEDEASPNAHEDRAKLKRKCETIAGKLKRLLPEVDFETGLGRTIAWMDERRGLFRPDEYRT